ncbi:hypothetical protein DPMN_013713 [Dreissena polymorpha]|uniref:Uncharacterized protein n=1 Tax=Dreissena polymorpha TaxID=45954 RepID=A0A9D4S4K1_DREPO|nr:hypothetical protein DPMN_013713 [Dreissena polymorpha]
MDEYIFKWGVCHGLNLVTLGKMLCGGLVSSVGRVPGLGPGLAACVYNKIPNAIVGKCPSSPPMKPELNNTK